MDSDTFRKQLDLVLWKGRGYKPCNLQTEPEGNVEARSYFRPGEEDLAGARLLVSILPRDGKRCIWSTQRSLALAKTMEAKLVDDSFVPGHLLVILPPPSKVSPMVRALNARRSFYPRVEVLEMVDLLIPEALKRLPRRSWPRRVQPEPVLRDLGLEHRGELPLLRPDDLVTVVTGAVSGDVVAQKDGAHWTARLLVSPLPDAARRLSELQNMCREDRLREGAQVELRNLLAMRPPMIWLLELRALLISSAPEPLRRLELRVHSGTLIEDDCRVDVFSAGLATRFARFPDDATREERKRCEDILKEIDDAVADCLRKKRKRMVDFSDEDVDRPSELEGPMLSDGECQRLLKKEFGFSD